MSLWPYKNLWKSGILQERMFLSCFFLSKYHHFYIIFINYLNTVLHGTLNGCTCLYVSMRCLWWASLLCTFILRNNTLKLLFLVDHWFHFLQFPLNKMLGGSSSEWLVCVGLARSWPVTQLTLFLNLFKTCATNIVSSSRKPDCLNKELERE